MSTSLLTRSNIAEVLKTQMQFLLFRPVRPDLKRLGPLFMGVAFLFTWLAGIGRYWDNPRAEWWQLLGLGSVLYVFILALILWAILLPLRPRNWSYRNVLLFVMMTALPGILYAIPVERFMSLRAAQTANVWFLAIVATWRVALLLVFLNRSAGFGYATAVIATLLPVALIVSALALLNLEHVVFRIMAGIRPEDQTGNDAAYAWLVLITWFSMLASPALLGAYIALLAAARVRRKREAEAEARGSTDREALTREDLA